MNPLEWQANSECGSPSDFSFEREIPAMSDRDSMRHGKTDSTAPPDIFGGKKRVKNLPPNGLGNTGAII